MDANHQAPDVDTVMSTHDHVVSVEDGILFYPNSDMEDDDESSEDFWEQEIYHLYLFTIRKDLLQPFVKHLNRGLSLLGALLSACQELPGVQGLEDLKRLHPTALPSWLALDKTSDVLRYLNIRAGNHVLFDMRLEYGTTPARAAERKAQLNRFKRCRFQVGFASDRMLCNSPPIPLRVLDYLEAADLLSLSLVCKATHRASHYLFHREEKVLNLKNIHTDDLRPNKACSTPSRHNSAPARHRAMRAASLMCGRPEAVNVKSRCPSLLHNLSAAPDACTQPCVTSETYWMKYRHLTKLLDAGRVESVGSDAWMVDPEGWPSRDQGALAKLKRIFDGGDVDHEVLREGIPMAHRLYPDDVKKAVEGVAKVFEAARKHNQVVIMKQGWNY